jgi:hypothetical protein
MNWSWLRPRVAVVWSRFRVSVAHPVIRHQQNTQRSLRIPMARSALVVLLARIGYMLHNIEEYVQ